MKDKTFKDAKETTKGGAGSDSSSVQSAQRIVSLDSGLKQALSVFLCHSSGDKTTAKDLFQRLNADGIDPWLDLDRLLPGQDWELEIRKAVKKSDIIIVCLSESSINKKGFVQKEIKYALDVADEQPEGTIFLIPLRLEACEVPDRLRRRQWVDYFEPDGYERLCKALGVRAQELRTKGSSTTSNEKKEQSLIGASSVGSENSPGNVPTLIAITRFVRRTFVFGVLGSALFLISSIVFLSQWMSGGKKPQSVAPELQTVPLNQPTESHQINQPVQRNPLSKTDFALFPGSVRADGVTMTVRFSPDLETLRFHLVLIEDQYQSYRAELRTEDERSIWENPNLRAVSHTAGRAVIMDLSRIVLKPGYYRINLSGQTVDGSIVHIASYDFRVVYQ
jgi:hypothetical protein